MFSLIYYNYVLEFVLIIIQNFLNTLQIHFRCLGLEKMDPMELMRSRRYKKRPSSYMFKVATTITVSKWTVYQFYIGGP